MVFIYQADSEVILGQYSLQSLIGELPDFMRPRARRYKNVLDACNFVLGRMLLMQGIDDLGLKMRWDQLSYHPDGKPLLEGLNFNLSHSDRLVACAITTGGRVGIDLEKIREVSFTPFESWFTAHEWTDIHQATRPLRRFYWYWTRKESILKALGLKLSSLNQIEFDATQDIFTEGGNTFQLASLDFGPEFSGALCAEGTIEGITYIPWRATRPPQL